MEDTFIHLHVKQVFEIMQGHKPTSCWILRDSEQCNLSSRPPFNNSLNGNLCPIPTEEFHKPNELNLHYVESYPYYKKKIKIKKDNFYIVSKHFGSK